MKLLSLIFLLSIEIVAQSLQFQPLSSADKKLFNGTYESMRSAFNDRNYQAILKFAPGTISRFQSIILDEHAKDLRAKYDSVQSWYNASLYLTRRDSIVYRVDSLTTAHAYRGALTVLDSLLSTISATDSIYRVKYPVYRKLYREYYRNNPSYEVLDYVGRLRNVDQSFVDSCVKSIQSTFEQRLLTLSSDLNVDSLIEFQRNYPQIMPEDVAALVDKAYDKYRLSVLRNPSAQVVTEYYKRFPLDARVESAHESYLYRAFVARRDTSAAFQYLGRFPQGRYLQKIQGFLDSTATGQVAASLAPQVPSILHPVISAQQQAK